jgi:hypothetical protein
MKNLEHCDKLFHRYFDPWYNEEARRRRGFIATRPDMILVEQLIGADATRASPLTENGQAKTREQIETMINAARGDWQEYLPIRGEIDIHWVKAFDTYYDRTRVSDVITRSDPKDFGCDYIVLCCEFGAVMGLVMRLLRPGLVWYLDWPYWDSMLLDSKSGNVIPVFHWAIKKMSGYGIDDGFADKIKKSLEILG